MRTILAIAPVHLQALKATGAYEQRQIGNAIALIRDVSTAAGATVIDLSELLPEERYFTDVNTHFAYEGNQLVSATLLRELRRVLVSGN